MAYNKKPITTSVSKNFIYNFMLNIANILFPLVTSPYVSRVLGVENIGKYSFSFSFANWFLIFAAFGTATYGVREVAARRENKESLNKLVTEILIINAISSLICLTIYMITIFSLEKTSNEIPLFLIVGLLLVFNMFSIDWLYAGLEDFRYVTLRSLVVKVISVVCIFLYVRGHEDYRVYALISVLSVCATNLFNLLYSRKFIKCDFHNLNLRQHLSILKVFFITNIAVSTYTMFDQVMLGFLSTQQDVAFFSRSKQVYSIAISVTLSISTVLLPKMAYLCNTDFEQYKRLLQNSLNYIYIFAIPSVLGLIVLSKDIMLLFGGADFGPAYVGVVILAVLVFVVALGTWHNNQVWLPLGKEKIILRIQMIMALISLSMNTVLIPHFGYIGACFSLVITELAGTLYSITYVKRNIATVHVTYLTPSIPKYGMSAVLMVICVIFVKLSFDSYKTVLFLGVMLGAITYFAFLILTKEELMLDAFRHFKQRLKEYLTK